MAVEAVSQHHFEMHHVESLPGYIVRNLNISYTMQVPDDEFGVEVITTLQDVRFATQESTPRAWFEFRISSVLPESDNWVEHCSGYVTIHAGNNTESSD